MLLYLVVFIGVLLFLYGVGKFIQWLGGREEPKFFVAPSANTGALIVNQDDKSGKMTTGGGTVKGFSHAIPGKKVDTNLPDPMDWMVKDLDNGEKMDPAHDNFIRRRLGVDWMGLFSAVRTNSDEHLRYRTGSAGGEIEPNKDKLPKFIPYSVDAVARLKDLETLDQLKISFDINLILERVYFVRSVLKVSNPISYLESMLNDLLNKIVGQHSAAEYRGGSTSEALKKELTEAIMGDEFINAVLDALGLQIVKASVLSPTMSEEQEKILEQQVKAEADARVKRTNADAELYEKTRQNAAAAEFFDKVTKPTLELQNEPKNKLADAIEKTKVGTLVLGGEASTLIGGK